MDKTFRSKVDIWLLIVIYAIIIASVAPIAYSGDILVSVVIAALLIVPITVYMFSIKYIVRGSSLIVKDGLFSHTYSSFGFRFMPS